MCPSWQDKWDLIPSSRPSDVSIFSFYDGSQTCHAHVIEDLRYGGPVFQTQTRRMGSTTTWTSGRNERDRRGSADECICENTDEPCFRIIENFTVCSSITSQPVGDDLCHSLRHESVEVLFHTRARSLAVPTLSRLNELKDFPYRSSYVLQRHADEGRAHFCEPNSTVVPLGHQCTALDVHQSNCEIDEILPHVGQGV